MMLLLATSIITISFQTREDAAPAVETNITVTTDSNSYRLRDKVTVSGYVSIDGSPASDVLVSVEVNKPDQKPLLYRTLPVGTPNETWVLQVTAIGIFDLDWKPLDTVKPGSIVYFGAKIYNPMYVTREPVIVTICIVDGNNIPIAAGILYKGSISGKSEIGTNKTISIPTYACPGEAFIYVNVYDKLPSEGGVAYIPEAFAKFYISQWNQGVSGSLPLEVYINNSSSTSSYQTEFRLPPSPKPGDYAITTVARYSPTLKTYGSSSFEVIDLEYPPQASFIYSPLEPYPNQTVIFDASFSTAEGYGDEITQYRWDFGDGNVTTTTNPIISHRFIASGQYIVTLNVTDTEGYWSTAQRPIYIKKPNPVAEFTWNPLTPRLNVTVIFNATMSQPGWSISKASPAPIVLYMWNFGDTTITYNTTEPIISHIYTEPGNFTVTLTVIDSENQQDTIAYVISVENATSPLYDINGDGKVDIRDVAIVAKAYGSYPGAPNWDPRADITGPEDVPDGKVDIRDIALVASHYGEYV